MNRLYTRTFFIAFVSQSGFVMANLLMAHYARWIAFLGGSVQDVGWIMGVSAAGALVLRPWTGQWLNRLGARNMWALGYAFFLVGTLGNLVIYDLGFAVVFLRTSLVLGVACVSASSLTYISQTAPPDRQAEAIGVLGVAGFIGFIIGPYIGDLILGADERTRSDFALLFLTSSAILIFPTILLWFLQKPAENQRSREVRLADFVGNAIRYWPGMIALVMIVFGMCMTVPLAFLAKYIDEAHLAIPGISEIGVFFVCYALIGVSIRLGLRQIPDRFGRRKVLLIGTLVMATGMFSFLLVDAKNAWWLIAPGLLCGAGHGLMFHTGTALMIETFPDNVRGTGSALSFMMLDLGLSVGSPILGWIADDYGYDWLFATIGGSCLAVGVAYGWLLLWRR